MRRWLEPLEPLKLLERKNLLIYYNLIIYFFDVRAVQPLKLFKRFSWILGYA